MPLRLIDVYLPDAAEDRIREAIAENPAWRILGVWSTELGDNRSIVKILADVQETEAITDHLTGQFSHDQNFRIIVMPVETSIPLPKDEEAKPEKRPQPSPGRVSREELYAELQDAARTTPVFITLVLLSTIVAAIGLARDNTAVIIGAMVIAPLLGPTIALAFAAMLGDGPLARRSARTAAIGILLAFAAAVPIGMLLNIDPTSPEIALRTEVSPLDIVLGLAAGGAGAVSMTAAVPGAVIGVMVAVALLPPLAVAGMLLGAGAWQPAAGALLLLGINLICIHLSAMITFLLQGIRPSQWWEARRARRAMLQSLAVSAGTLILLAGLIYLAYYRV